MSPPPAGSSWGQRPGAVSVNGRRAEEGARLREADLLAGGVVLLRRGKRLWHATVWG